MAAETPRILFRDSKIEFGSIRRFRPDRTVRFLISRRSFSTFEARRKMRSFKLIQTSLTHRYDDPPSTELGLQAC